MVAFLLVTAMMPVAKAASLYFGIVAHPSSDRPHEKPTALLGGLAVMVAFVAAIGFVGIVSGLPYHSIPWLTGFALAMCLVGLLDDIVDLRPRNKLLLELAAICILVWWGPHLDFFPYDPLNIALTIFWLVTATNAFNLIDGIDGLAAGVGIVAALSIAAVAGLHQHAGTMIAALAMAGALAGFMVFNFPPASVFMGDEGALAVGLVLGVLSIQGSHFGEGSLPARLAMPLLALMVPLLDIVTVTVTRLARGNPISRRGLDHSHHRLTRLGMSSCARGGSADWHPGYSGRLCDRAQPGAGLRRRAADSVHGAVLRAGGVVPDGSIVRQRGARPNRDLPADRAHYPELWLQAPIRRVDPGYGAGGGGVLWRDDAAIRLRSEHRAGGPDAGGLAVDRRDRLRSFLVAGVYRGIWRYTGLAEGVRFVLAAMIAGLAVKLAAAFLPISISRATVVVFMLLLFNFLVATRWSFHVFHRIGRFLAHPARRLVIVGADARGAAAVQHFTRPSERVVELLGLVDDDGFKHGKLSTATRCWVARPTWT